MSAFYNGEFSVASEYLEKEMGDVEPEAASSSGAAAAAVQRTFQIDVALVDLECDIYQNKCQEIDEKCRSFIDHFVSLKGDENVEDIDVLRWIEELKCSNRHFGSIILCRALMHRLAESEKGTTERRFNLCYYLFVEIAIRVAYLLHQNPDYSDVTKFILACMDDGITIMKSDWHGEKWVAVGFLALSFCCNCARLHESAEKCADEGLLRAEGKVRADLLVNKAASYLGRRDISPAEKYLREAKSLLKVELQRLPNSNPIKWRKELIKKMLRRLETMRDNMSREDRWSQR